MWLLSSQRSPTSTQKKKEKEKREREKEILLPGQLLFFLAFIALLSCRWWSVVWSEQTTWEQDMCQVDTVVNQSWYKNQNQTGLDFQYYIKAPRGLFHVFELSKYDWIKTYVSKRKEVYCRRFRISQSLATTCSNQVSTRFQCPSPLPASLLQGENWAVQLVTAFALVYMQLFVSTQLYI